MVLIVACMETKEQREISLRFVCDDLSLDFQSIHFFRRRGIFGVCW